MEASETVAGVNKLQGAFQALSALGLFFDLWPRSAFVPDGATYHFIIVGAGTAGCVVANRLTEISNVSVLLIEAGGNPPLESVRPGLLPFLRHSKVDWNNTSEDSHQWPFHKNDIPDISSGKMLGGSSSMNFMAYTRGNFHDYNNWAEITNDSSWNWDNVLPYFMKSEDLLSQRILNSESGKFHGTRGLMKVTKLNNDVFEDYLNAFEEAGLDKVEDTNGDHPLGYSEASVNVAYGKRQSSALAFLSTAKNRKNLHVLKDAVATKIIFKDKKAVGVKVDIKNNGYYKTIDVFARNEVIISAGAFRSPQILMLSGIGPKDHLKEHNIETIVDLPVGQNLQDHTLVTLIHKMKRLKTETPSLNPDKHPLVMFIGYAAINKTQEYPDYQTLNAVQDINTFLSFCAYYSYVNELCQQIYEEAKGHELLYTLVAHIYPKSRGKVLLRSTNPHDQPLIYTNYYSDSTDIEKHASYVKHFLKVSQSEFFRDSDATLLIPDICGCADDEFECYVRCLWITGYHYSGSVPMGTVLDSRLRVLGLENVRVVDASVMPVVTGANTHAPTLMIGERAADFIKEDNFMGCKI